MFVSSASATDTGLRRSINEDSLLVRDDLGFFLVADGLGGHAAGEVAHDVVLQVVGEVAHQQAPSGEQRPPGLCGRRAGRDAEAHAAAEPPHGGAPHGGGGAAAGAARPLVCCQQRLLAP